MDELLVAERCLGTAKKWESAAKNELDRAKKNVESAEKEVKDAEELLSSVQRKWAAGAYILLHPNIYGQGELMSRIEQVAGALGVAPDTAKKWYGLNNQTWKAYADKWLPIVQSTKWKDVSTYFTKEWCDQWTVTEEEMITEEQLKSWAKGMKSLKRKRGLVPKMARVVNKSTTHSSPNDSKKAKRKDVGTPRKYSEQEAFVKELVSQRMNAGDPIGRHELYSELKARNDCDVGTDFYNNYIDPEKPSARSGLSNWVRRALERDGWSFQGKSIVKTPEELEAQKILEELNPEEQEEI